MLKIDPKEVSMGKLHNYLLGSVGPRPIAFASTIDKDGNRNLSPFSFFNVFSAAPPIAIFSPAKSGRTNTQKNTYDNIKETMEVVINIVNFDLVQQMSLSSTAYEKGVDEFVKAGLTPIASDLVKPFRVKESPVQLECKVREVVELGDVGGSGNLIICEIVMVHINEAILGEDGTIDQHKIDLVGRMGGNYYVRASGDCLFEVPKPVRNLGIGIDQLPEPIRKSTILTGNDLGMLGNVEELPKFSEKTFSENWEEKQRKAQKLLIAAKINEAWEVLIS
ncbi:MAG: flavin reductase family protein [Bacteroidetes bacterium]|nr:MAG: flavin reductase family protein [Bacteroidota bacterium]MBL1143974.1 flavin reductase family protein [Bacteroidota bacterium]NOG56775.1 flavin reductase family protein [Bacteroidota bacterium]